MHFLGDPESEVPSFGKFPNLMNLAGRELALTLKLKNPKNLFSQPLLHLCWEHMI